MQTIRRLWAALSSWGRSGRPSSYHCDECDRPVPVGEGVGEGRYVWCGEEHARVGVDRMQW